MEGMIFDDFDFYIDPEKIKMKIKMDDEEIIEMVDDLCSEAQKIARPRVALATTYIDKITEEEVQIEDITFRSPLLSKNLRETKKIIPYIMTCGREIYDWANKIDGYLECYIAEEIKIRSLSCSQQFFSEYIKLNVFPEKSNSMNPGSLKDWPLTEQIKLFKLLDTPAKKIGVVLTESCLMIPDKSVSGLLFQKEKSFVNCMLCERENCPNRSTKYKREMI